MKSLDAQILEGFYQLNKRQKEALIMRFKVMIAAQGPPCPMLPPSPNPDLVIPSNADEAEFIRLLKLHPETYPALRRILTSGAGKSSEASNDIEAERAGLIKMILTLTASQTAGVIRLAVHLGIIPPPGFNPTPPNNEKGVKV